MMVGVRNEPMAGTPRYTGYGLDLRENSSVVSHGMPNKPNIFADAQTVQEQDAYASSSLFVPDFQGSPSDAAPVMDFRFNKLYAPAGGFQVWGGDWEFVYYNDNLASYDSLVNWTMRDCELRGGRISLGLPYHQIDLTQYYGSGAVDWENNLFENVNLSLNPATWWLNGVVNFDEAFTARNNLFKGANWLAVEPVRVPGFGSVTTSNYIYYMTVGSKFSFLERTRLAEEQERVEKQYLWPISRIDTNAAYQTAEKLLVAASIDVQALNRDCIAQILPLIPDGEEEKHFVPIYTVYWMKQDQAGSIAEIEFVEPTKTILQMHVMKSEYILRKPLMITNVDFLFSQTNAPATTHVPAKQ